MKYGARNQIHATVGTIKTADVMSRVELADEPVQDPALRSAVAVSGPEAAARCCAIRSTIVIVTGPAMVSLRQERGLDLLGHRAPVGLRAVECAGDDDARLHRVHERVAVAVVTFPRTALGRVEFRVVHAI
jgi:hypothetical protein